ncbi:MAG: hypothetical protein KAI33_02775, partial [Elusimicrobiales bacterium]|nr:hypothetical protein [Elusimicrobiales bacterium]
TSGKYYILQTKAEDRAANEQSGFTQGVSSMTFIWDDTPPETTINVPIDEGKYKPSDLTGVNAINGNATDAVLPYTTDHLNKVQIHLSYLKAGDTYYWTGSAFSSYTVTFDGAWQDAIGTDTWKYPYDGADWVSDENYRLITRAFDTAKPFGANGGNEQDPWTEYGFVMDGTPPVSKVSTPTAGSFIQSSISEISGTSYGGASGLQSGAPGLKLRVYYVAGIDTYYWQGTTALGWSSETVKNLPVDFNASASTEAWTYPPVGYDLPTISTHNQVYSFSIAGLDEAGNQEDPLLSVITVTSDLNYPTIVISTPMSEENAFYGTARTINILEGGSSDGPSGIVPPIKTQISNMSESGAVKPKWDGGIWDVVVSTWLGVTDINPWNINSPAWIDNKKYKVEMRAVDEAQNETPDGAYIREFIYDVNKPSSTIVAPSAAFHNYVQIETLSGSAIDWVHFSATQSYSGIMPDDGIEIQIAKGADTYTGSGFDDQDNWKKVNMTVTDSDSIFGITRIRSADWDYPKVPDIWPPVMVEGSTYTVRVKTIDRSLNLETYIEKQFCYDNSAPTATVTLPDALAYTALPQMEGDISETISALNPSDGIQILIQRDADSEYWNGADWDASGSYDAATHWKDVTNIGVPSWTHIDANLAAEFNSLTASLKFKAYVRAKDVAGNISRPDAPAPSTDEILFTMDRFAPVSITTYPALGDSDMAYINEPITNIAGTAAEIEPGIPSGLNN